MRPLHENNLRGLVLWDNDIIVTQETKMAWKHTEQHTLADTLCGRRQNTTALAVDE